VTAPTWIIFRRKWCSARCGYCQN